MLRLLACVPGTTWERWLCEVTAGHATVEVVACAGLACELDRGGYAGVIMLLDHRVMPSWEAIRSRLVASHIPVILFTPLAVEPLRLLALERELRLVALHVVGFDDHPALLRGSVNRLLSDDILRRLLRHFGADALALEALVGPLWEQIGSTRSLEEWARRAGRDLGNLRRDLRSRGIRHPRRFLTWLRLLAAWSRLHAGASSSSVAVEVGYSAAPALTRSTRRFLGFTPSAVRSVPLETVIAQAAADLVA